MLYFARFPFPPNTKPKQQKYVGTHYRLAPVLERAASFGSIFVLEVDAQGADAEVVYSGGAMLQHVPRLILECQEAY